MRKIYFMHLLDGEPAYFTGEQLCYLPTNSKHNWQKKGVLVETVDEIHRQQAASLEYREKNGFSNEAEQGWVQIPLYI